MRLPSTSRAYELLEAIASETDLEEARNILHDANDYWEHSDAADRDDVLDAAQLLVEAMTLRLSGNVALALKREAFLDRILRAYGASC